MRLSWLKDKIVRIKDIADMNYADDDIISVCNDILDEINNQEIANKLSSS